MKIIINKRIDWPTAVIIMMFISGFLEGTLGISSIVYFLIDIPIIIMLIKKKHVLEWNRLKQYGVAYIVFAVALLCLSQIIYAFVRFDFSLNTIYGLYRTYRPLLYFLCCFSYLTIDNIKRTNTLMKIVFIINIILMAFQFLFMGIQQDYLNGIFGTKMGNNAYVNLFYVVVACFLLAGFFYDYLPSNRVIAGVAIMLLSAALSEMKFFFVEILAIVIVCFLLKLENPKNIIRIIIIVIAAIVFYEILILRYPEFETLVSQLLSGGIDRLISLQRHYSTNYDIGRAVFMQRINEDYFKIWYHYLFGLGIGNCTSSSFVDNSFYIINSFAHYDQFQTAYTYIEQGWFGFILYLSILIYPALVGMKTFLLGKKNIYSTQLILLGMMGVFMFYYNMALYSQYSFIYFWSLASVFYLQSNSYIRHPRINSVL